MEPQTTSGVPTYEDLSSSNELTIMGSAAFGEVHSQRLPLYISRQKHREFLSGCSEKDVRERKAACLFLNEVSLALRCLFARREIGIRALPEGKKDARVACVAGERITPSQAVTGQH